MQKQRKEKRPKEENSKWVLIGIVVVVVTMIASGLFIGTRQQTTPGVSESVDVVDLNYSLAVAQTRVIAYANESLNEFIVIPSTFQGSYDNIKNIKNTSVNGTKKIMVEMATNKNILIFKFIIDKNSGETEDQILENIKSKFRYQLSISDSHKDIYRGFNGFISGLPGKIYLIAGADTKPGDYVFGTWYNRKINNTVDNLVITQETIKPCGNSTAKVVNIANVIVTGEVYGNFDSNFVSSELNTSINFIKPKIINITGANQKIDQAVKEFKNKFNFSIISDNTTNTTTMTFSDFTILTRDITENNTNKTYYTVNYIEFNGSLGEINKILDNYGILRSTEKGSIQFNLNNERWNSELENRTNSILNKQEIKNIVMEKDGFVSVPEACIEEGKLVMIKNNINFKAVLNLSSNPGSIVKVAINTYIMSQGEEKSYIPYMAVQV